MGRDTLHVYKFIDVYKDLHLYNVNMSAHKFIYFALSARTAKENRMKPKVLFYISMNFVTPVINRGRRPAPLKGGGQIQIQGKIATFNNGN